MPLKPPIHPGQVIWSGENPGILLKQEPDGPLSAVALFFRIFYSPEGRGTALLLYENPEDDQTRPDSVNAMVTDNEAMGKYLMKSFIGKLPAFRDLPVFESTRFVKLQESYATGDPRSRYTEVIKTGEFDVELIWGELGTPTALELPPDLTGAKENELFTLLVESRRAQIVLNGSALPGEPFERIQAGIKTTTAFLYFAETWISPRDHPVAGV